MKRDARGEELPPEVGQDGAVLGYRGREGVVRRTLLQFAPAPTRLGPDHARPNLSPRPA
jgi:hypothetical protein